MGNESAKPQPTPRQAPQRQPQPFPRSRPNIPSVPPEEHVGLTVPTCRKDGGFVYIESIQRPHTQVNQQQNTRAHQQQQDLTPIDLTPTTQNTQPIPQSSKVHKVSVFPRSTSVNQQQNTVEPEVVSGQQVPHQFFEQNQIEDNSDTESVISEVSSVGYYRGNYHRGRGGRGRGFVQQGGIKKHYHQNYRNKGQTQQINDQKIRDLAESCATSVAPINQPLEESTQPGKVSVRTIENTLKNTKLTKSKKQDVINILLLGETGVGKSTFINSIVNYLSYGEFEQADREKLHILISSSFTAWDKELKPHQITVKNEMTDDVDGDKNEDLNVGNSATQQVKTYTFTIKNGEIRIRLIDTPGIGDTRGLKQDEINCQSILDYISQLPNLHAICYLFKPDNSRKTSHFNYCVTQMLSRLEKSACNNLVFLFTHTRGTNFTSGETYSLLKDLADEIGKQSGAAISIDHSKFCVDNEAFKHLVAVKQGVKFTDEVRAQNMKSWQKSSETCSRLIDHILKLKPHLVNSTLSINECRRHIIQLTQPMAEITLLIEDNISQLDRHKAHLHLYKDDLAELKEKLYVPILDVEVNKLLKPVTVCTRCAEPVKIGNRTKWHYSSKCCPDCPLRNVPKEIIGSPELTNCEQMRGPNQTCLVCSHHYKVHVHIYYETKIVEKKQIDDNIKKSVENKEALIETAKKILENLETRKTELEEERKEIIKYNAKFAYFLQKNALAPPDHNLNDSYEEYIEHMITSEKHSGSNSDTITSLQKLLNEHKEFKKSFAEAAELSKKTGESDTITPKNIQSNIQNLYKLKHFGDKIKDMYRKQTSNIKQEFSTSEYIHREVFKRLPHEKDDKNKAEQNIEKGSKKKQRKKKPQNNVDQNNQPQLTTNPTINKEPNQGFQHQSQVFNNQFQHHGHENQFNKYRGQPNNRRGFQRGGRRGRGNYEHRSRSRGPVQDREAPPPYDVAVQSPSFSSEPNQSGHQSQNRAHDFRGRSAGPRNNKNYRRDDQDPSKAGTTIQVNVTLAQPDQLKIEPKQQRNGQYTQERSPLTTEDRYSSGNEPDYRFPDPRNFPNPPNNQPKSHLPPYSAGEHYPNTGYDHQRNNYPPPPSQSWANPQTSEGPRRYLPHEYPPSRNYNPAPGNYPPDHVRPRHNNPNIPPSETFKSDNLSHGPRGYDSHPSHDNGYNPPTYVNHPPRREDHPPRDNNRQNYRPNEPSGYPPNANSQPQGGRYPNYQQENQRGRRNAGRGGHYYNEGPKKNQNKQ